MKGTASRKLAVEVLLKVELESAYANLALQSAFKRSQLSERDRAFVTLLVQGVIRHEAELDAVLSALTERPLDKIAPALRAVLRVALYQLLHLKNIPSSAVVNTSTELARTTGHQGSAKFANAVLRNFLKEGAILKPLAADANLQARLSRQYSMPQWLVGRWLERFGPVETEGLLEFSASVPELTLRTCQLSITPSALERILREKGMTTERSLLVPACINVIDRGPIGGPVSKIPGYSEGLFSVQDEAAALVSLVMAPQPGWAVVDLCAAPGGKTLHMAELMGNSGRVIAVDLHESRLNLLVKERRRLGLTNIEITAADGRTFSPGCRIDAVLVDAPCTGTGVLNRRSDIRQRRQPPDLHALTQTQQSLLANAANMLEPGGILVYATCSIEREENEDNVSWFLDRHPGFAPQPLSGFLSEEIIGHWSISSWWSETSVALSNGMLQLLPSRQGYSGFFVSRFRREF